jgi:hypothetical protein
MILLHVHLPKNVHLFRDFKKGIQRPQQEHKKEKPIVMTSSLMSSFAKVLALYGVCRIGHMASEAAQVCRLKNIQCGIIHVDRSTKIPDGMSSSS